MKKYGKFISGAVCLCVFAVLLLQLQFRFITLGNGERLLVYLPLSHRAGGSARADLLLELTSLYGEEGVQTEGLPCIWQGEAAVAYDTSSYDFQYLGRALAGGDYLLCTVVTTRSIVIAHENGETETLPDTVRTSTYLGHDDTDANSGVRAHILWDTLQSNYSDSEEYFNILVPA